MKDRSIAVHTHDDQSMLARYQRAEAIEQASYLETMVLNAQILLRWIGDSDCFWYKRSSRKNGHLANDLAIEYRLVNAKDATNTVAFDHTALGKALSAATDQAIDVSSLPIGQLEFDLENNLVCFQAFEKRWQWDGALKEVDTVNHPGHWLLSPDGSKAAFIKNYNLWVRELDSGEERALTQDGHLHYAYATQPESRDLVAGFTVSGVEGPQLPEAKWSPDSSRLFTLQTDERQVRSLPMVMHAPQDGSIAPRVSERRYSLSGDKHITRFRLLVIDVAAGREIAADYPPIDDSFPVWCLFSSNLAWWSEDGRHAYFVDMTRGQKIARVARFDSQTGQSKVLFEESSPTYVELGSLFEYPPIVASLPETNELIWPSERSGYWHLYLYDLSTGELKNAITSGDWLVRDVLHVDKDRRELLISIAGRVEGRNPYYRELVTVNIDTGDMTILASSDHDCYIRRCPKGVSCTGNFVVTTRARVDEAPVTELRDRHGEIILTVEAADISGLSEGWQWPEPVTMKADDGITDIYGVVFRPSDFDPDKMYPVLDAGMVMPFYSTLPTGAFLQGSSDVGGGDPVGNYLYMTMCAIAELGFIVTVMDGRGTGNRSKAFHDFGYGSFMDGAGMVDHVAGIKQLAKRYPYMDLEKVGVVSPDAHGNAALFGLLNYPDFFKVGVVWAPWDPRLLRQGEVYCGIINEAGQQQSIWEDAVHRLEGKLLVLTGMLDPFFNSSATLQLVDALVKANKDFDLRLHPNGSHAAWGVSSGIGYVWNYVVQHLQGVEPPKDFKLVTSVELAWSSLATEKID